MEKNPKAFKGTHRSPSLDITNEQSILTLSRSRSRSKGRASNKFELDKHYKPDQSKPLGFSHLGSVDENDPNLFDLTAKTGKSNILVL